MSKGVLQIDLTLLKRLVSEFENAIASTAKMEENEDLARNDYIVELSKIIGYTSGLVTEATLLMGDVQSLIKAASAGASTASSIEKLLKEVIKPSNGSTSGGFGGTN